MAIPPWQARAADFHPIMADAIEALPDSLRAAALAALPADVKFERALVIPADYRTEEGEGEEAHLIPEQALVFTSQGVLHVQASAVEGGQPSTVYVAPANLLYLRTYHILLYGRLEWHGAADGRPVDLSLEFNAVAWPLMGAEWREVISRAIGLPPAERTERELTSREQALLAVIPAKFAEGLRRYGLYTGETLIGATFQSALWTQTFPVFDRQIMPNTLVALTNYSVLILEEERALARKIEQLGLVITRIPITSIVNVQSESRDGLEELCISMEREGVTAELRYLLEPARAQYWRGLWEGRTVEV